MREPGPRPMVDLPGFLFRCPPISTGKNIFPTKGKGCIIRPYGLRNMPRPIATTSACPFRTTISATWGSSRRPTAPPGRRPPAVWSRQGHLMPGSGLPALRTAPSGTPRRNSRQRHPHPDHGIFSTAPRLFQGVSPVSVFDSGEAHHQRHRSGSVSNSSDRIQSGTIRVPVSSVLRLEMREMN